MRPTLRTLLALLIVGSLHVPAATPQETSQPAFTLRSRLTVHREDGEKVVLDEVRYVSSDGNFRLVTTRADGSATADKVYVRGRGLFLVSHDYKMLRRWREPLPDATDVPPPTAEQLRASPNFLRTETVLGRETYLHRVKDEKTGQPLYDYYFAPELGKTPLKTIEYGDGKVREVSEPVSVAFGEPEAAQVQPPAYEEVENFPISGGILNGKAVEKPAPAYPVIVNAERVEGTVVVQVMVDEEGKVVSAQAVSGHPLLRQAAVEAAHKARFSPTLLSGKPVKVTGTLSYNFKRN
jgi:TonB family protein